MDLGHALRALRAAVLRRATTASAGCTLDLLALVGFSVSLAFFNDARLELSVPLCYPLLAYLLARLLWIGLRRSAAPAEPLRLNVPWRWLAIARSSSSASASASTRPTGT